MRRRPSISLLVALVATCVVAGPAHGVATGPLSYAALGDSIAGGHGLLDDGSACRRSKLAYPFLVRAALRERYASVRFRNLACTGATAAGPASDPSTLASQVTAFLSRPTTVPTLVTLTVGINDFDWSNVLATYARLRDPDQPGFELWVSSTSAHVADAVRAQLRRLLARKRVVVVITDYPNPVNAQSLLFGPPEPCVDPAACYARTELVVQALDDALADVASGRARVRLAAVHDAFLGHEAPSPECGGAAPAVAGTWFQYPSDPDSNSFPTVPPGLGIWRGDCFHPNAAGQAEYAEAVASAALALGR